MNTKTVLACTFAVLLLGVFPMVFAQSVTVTDYTHSFEEWDNSDWYDGIIENMGETTAVFPDITISYYDEDHALIHSTTTSAEFSYIGPGEIAPFTIIVDHMNFTSLEFSVEYSDTTALPYRDFTITEVSRGTDIWGLNTVTYDVKNTGEVDLESITLYGIHFDASSGFLDYSQSYLVEELASGETTSIELEMIPLETVDSYVVVDVFEMAPESSSTGGDTEPNIPSDTDTEPASGGGIPGFPFIATMIGVAVLVPILRKKTV
jgi:hypothetical protein